MTPSRFVTRLALCTGIAAMLGGCVFGHYAPGSDHMMPPDREGGLVATTHFVPSWYTRHIAEEERRRAAALQRPKIRMPGEDR